MPFHLYCSGDKGTKLALNVLELFVKFKCSVSAKDIATFVTLMFVMFRPDMLSQLLLPIC